MKSLLTAGALLALSFSSAFAHAQPIHWTFSYTGFHDQEAQSFDPGMTLSGSFSGDDANGDGLLERQELASLMVGDTDYVACSAGNNASYHCGVDSFAFTAAHGLSFSLGAYGSDPEGWVGGGWLIETGNMRYDYAFNPGGGSEHHLLWTADTLLQMASMLPVAADAAPVTLAAVPEPATWAILGLGMVGIGLSRRRPR